MNFPSPPSSSKSTSAALRSVEFVPAENIMKYYESTIGIDRTRCDGLIARLNGRPVLDSIKAIDEKVRVTPRLRRANSSERKGDVL